MTITHAPNGTPVIGIVGWKNSGKTTLTVKLVEEFTRRGLRVATVKHAHHSFQIDDAETDSARHRRGGAKQIAIVSAKRWALVTELGDAIEPDFADVLAALAPADLIIVEGYKSAPIRKIEARRGASSHEPLLAASDSDVIAIAADVVTPHLGALPVFQIDDVRALAGFLARVIEHGSCG
jgi:molybdopterin-guanine dinucleotide biosynthesis adapter protein